MHYALERLNEIKDKKIKFDIYGPIEDKEYWEKCLRIIENISQNINVQYRGRIKHEEIFNTFSKYDLFFFPTLSENYGHVIAEALFSGVPVLISDQTPWTDINKHKAGAALPLSNKDAFLDFLERLDPGSDELDNLSANARKYIFEKSSIDLMKKQYMEFFDNV